MKLKDKMQQQERGMRSRIFIGSSTESKDEYCGAAEPSVRTNGAAF